MNKKLSFWLLTALVALACVGVTCCAVTFAGWQLFSGLDTPLSNNPAETLSPRDDSLTPEEAGESSPLPPLDTVSEEFRQTACPFPGDYERVSCGFLDVPEDRAMPEGLTISLAVAIVASKNGSSGSVPLVYLEGGPGGSALDGLVQLWLHSPLGDERDIILLDQRGTGYSEPTLNCPELEDDDGQDWFDAVGDCRDRLKEAGVNLDMYNSAASAADVADLRLALGYDQIDLLGISYGTRLALTVMRDWPEGIRSVILDSVYPPQVDALNEQPQTILRALEEVFEGCKLDADCNKTYPGLERVLYELVETLNEDPAVVMFYDEEKDEDYPEEVWGDYVVDTLIDSLYDTRMIPYLPAYIYAMYDGDYEEAYDILDIPYQNYTYPYPEEDYVPPDEDVSDSEGMFYSVECREEVYFNSVDAAEAAVESYPFSITEGLIWQVEDFFFICDLWGTIEAPPLENEPVRSGIPTLVLNGEYDPVTPPAWASQTADYLSNSQLFIFPGYGHGVIDAGPCPLQLMLDFLANPDSPVDSGCLAEVGPVDFVENP